MVWKNPELPKQVTVPPDGNVSFPLIGDIIAVGKTAAQLSDLCPGRSGQASKVLSQEHVSTP